MAQSNKPEPFPIRLFSGKSEPCDPEEFLWDFVEEIADFQTNGLNDIGQIFNISISNFVCDAPARADKKSVKSHSGYSGYDKCTQVGEYRGKITFPETDVPLRTGIAFDESMCFSIHIRLHAPSLPWCGEASPFTVDEGSSPVSFRGSGKNIHFRMSSVYASSHSTGICQKAQGSC